MRKDSEAVDIAVKLNLDPSGRKKGRAKKWLLVVVAALIVLATALWLSRRESGQKVTYKTEKARKGDLTVTVSATGTLQPTKQVDVGSEISGTIREVMVDFNSLVTAGQVLARLDTNRLEAQVQQAEANLAAARAKIPLARATVEESAARLARFEQANALSGGKVPSPHEMESAVASLARAKAEEAAAVASVSQNEAALKALKTDLAKASILSPINGIVLKRAVDPGQTVAATFQTPVLFTIAEDLTQMELNVDVDEADVGKVREGQVATFTVDAYPDQRFPGKVTQVRFGSQTVDGVVTYRTVIEVKNPKMLLRPGMTATAEIVVESIKDALLVPNSALRYEPPALSPKTSSGGPSFISRLFPRPPSARSGRPAVQRSGKNQAVYVLDKDSPRPVQVLIGLTDGRWTQILKGDLSEGSVLVIEQVTKK
jgi:HlyD family secretion protein